jgi:hypothetical protein
MVIADVLADDNGEASVNLLRDPELTKPGGAADQASGRVAGAN